MNRNIDTSMFELDDEDMEDTSTIDSSHQFLNFSRKVAEAASMRKPVDIQLGIACGKDLFFPSFIKNSQKFPNIQIQDNDSPQPMFANSSENSLSSLLESYSPKDTMPSPTLSESTVVKDEPFFEKEASIYSFSDRDSQQDTVYEYEPPNVELSTFDFSTNDSFYESDMSEDANSLSLDQLVADVFSYMDSCPNHSAYSSNLRSLKSKLKDYNNSRTSLENDL